MNRFIAALALILLLVVGGTAVSAQTIPDCPAAHVCVTYKKDIIEIDPKEGPYQAFVVQERIITVKDLDGSRTRREVTLAGFQVNGDTYELTGEYTVDQAGPFLDAFLGDVFTLSESTE